jgi:hypothetical protein
MGGGLFGCFVCECEAVMLALSSVDRFGDFTWAYFLFFLSFSTCAHFVSSAS